jgi:hypothetical protein
MEASKKRSERKDGCIDVEEGGEERCAPKKEGIEVKIKVRPRGRTGRKEITKEKFRRRASIGGVEGKIKRKKQR